jgi:2-polyprenyl-3-methyl-5-hydroxy-6-metoxy-1,4-benzoquinol methylase
MSSPSSADVRLYWDAHIHDLAVSTHPPGTQEFFRDLDVYHFEKLHHLLRLVDFDAWRDRAVLDVGCGAGTFLAALHDETGARVSGVDFVDLSGRPALSGVDFRHGQLHEQRFGTRQFDLITLWHFLEHDYGPLRSLATVRDLLQPDGRAIIEVPRLDSLSFRIFGNRWPGLQAPQHTALYEKATLLALVDRAGLEVVDYLPYGAFPPYFYLFCGTAFRLRPGRGLNLRRAAAAYFAGQIVALPVLPFLKHANFAMQTVVCRRRS